MARVGPTKAQIQDLLASAEYRNLPCAKERALKLVLEEAATIPAACAAVSRIDYVSTRCIERAKRAISEGRTPFASGNVAILSPSQEEELVQFLI